MQFRILTPAAALAIVSGPILAQSAAPPVPASEPPRRESGREFLDSLSDTALAPDRNALYRKDGARREVDLGGGFTAVLDELAPTRRDSPVALPGQANAPSRVVGLMLRRPGLFGDLTSSRSSVARNTSLGLRWDLFEQISLLADTHEQHSVIPSIDARRRDSGLGLRWPPDATSWVEFGLHRASIQPDADPPGADTVDAAQTFWRARGRWEPASVPGLGLSLRGERAATRPVDPQGAGTLELGADYRFDNGVQLTWREAPRLGLLSEGNALEPQAAYRRSIGVEVPDGSPGGAVYTQWRDRSLASSDDALWVLGWRHAWKPAERWLLQGFVEQAVPVSGPSAVRSFAVGGRLWRGAFPDNTFVTDLQLVNSDRDDSLYTSIKYTWRVSETLLGALRGSLNHSQPHGMPDAGSTSYKTSATLGWREPEQRKLAVLGRWTFLGTEVTEAGALDRRAHIALLGGNLDVGESDAVSARVSRRWDRDENRPSPDVRVTTLTMARWVHELGGRHSISVHAARRGDSIEGSGSGLGAEWGIRLSSKAVLAVGYNLRGFDDHEIEFDERLKKGFTLRLRFSIDAVLGRWLDAPMPRRTP